MLAHAQRYLAEDPTSSDVLSIFAGQRPLVRGKAGAATASLSREHAMIVGTGGMLTVTGGKWTTYREMAEQVVDLAARLGGLPARLSPTADLRLHGAGEQARTVYGDDEPAVLSAGAATPLHPRLPHTEAEVRWAASVIRNSGGARPPGATDLALDRSES